MTLDLENTFENITIGVRTIRGELVSKSNYRSTSSIDFEIEQSPGIYIVEVTNEQGNTAKIKVLKQ